MNILGIASIIMLCSRFWITKGMRGKIESLVQLPNWECDQCILQWTRAANSLGTWEPGSHEMFKLKRIFW